MPPDHHATLHRLRQLQVEMGDYTAAWQATREWFEQAVRDEGGKSGTQGWRSVSGRVFEMACRATIEDGLKASGQALPLAIKLWQQIPTEIRDGVLSERVWGKGSIHQPSIVQSYVDIIAAIADEKDNVESILAVFSCKTSVRGRYQQDLFWVEKLRARGIRFCFVTLDPAFLRYATSGGQRTPSRTITLASAMYDRIYLFTEEEIDPAQRTFRPISEAAGDLASWYQSY